MRSHSTYREVMRMYPRTLRYVAVVVTLILVLQVLHLAGSW
jgi:hypothetical protein